MRVPWELRAAVYRTWCLRIVIASCNGMPTFSAYRRAVHVTDEHFHGYSRHFLRFMPVDNAIFDKPLPKPTHTFQHSVLD